MRNHLWMLLSLGAGLLIGLVAAGVFPFLLPLAPSATWLATVVKPLGTLFLNLLSMVVIPLVTTAVFTGIAGLGAGKLGRLGARTFGYFWSTQVVGIVLGFALAGAILPLAPLTPERRAAFQDVVSDSSRVVSSAANIPTGAQILVQLIPANPVKAAVDGSLLPLVIFTAIFALAASRLPDEKRKVLTDLADAASRALFTIVRWVLLLAPIGIFALVAPAVARLGWSLVKAMLLFTLVVAGGCVLITALHAAGARVLAKLNHRRFLKAATPPLLMGFSTASSAAALPALFDAAERDLKISHSVAGVVLPVGITLHRAGSSLYMAAAVVFIAQLYGTTFGAAQLVQAGLAVFLASLTVAPVPYGSVISLAPAFSASGLPLAGLQLLIALDRFPDMFRTATNVTGHLAGAAIVATGEGEQVG